MEHVPALFIKSVLSLFKIPTVEPVKKLSSRSWSQLAADQMARRKNWILRIDDSADQFMGYFMEAAENVFKYASFDEFGKKDRYLNQITGIWVGGYIDEEDEEVLQKSTKIASKQDAESLKRRFFPRINYAALKSLWLGTMDSVRLDSTILHHIVDNDANIEILRLSYEGPTSTELLEKHVQGNLLTHLAMYGEWPLESTVSLIEALVPQRQLREFHYFDSISLSESFFTSLVADWEKADSPEDKEIVFWNLDTAMPLEVGVRRHPNSQAQLKVDTDISNSKFFRLHFSAVPQ
uniref:F-box domain-containing protein n=1 Tax=Steinernema glaseri TaxID=37863 RepID=A0A1I7ZCQ8_9BILA